MTDIKCSSRRQEQTHDAYGSSSRFGCQRRLVLRRRSGGERRVFDLLVGLNAWGLGGSGGSGFFGDDLCEVKGLSEVGGGEEVRRKGLGGLASMTGHGYLVVPITAESQRVWKSEQNNECDWDFMGMTNKLGFFALVGHTQIQFYSRALLFRASSNSYAIFQSKKI